MTATVDDRLLTPDEAGEVLQVSAYTIRQWAREGKVPSVRLGGKTVRFWRSSLLEWAKSKETGPR